MQIILKLLGLYVCMCVCMCEDIHTTISTSIIVLYYYCILFSTISKERRREINHGLLGENQSNRFRRRNL